MAINIKPNNYKEVTECREEVVQYICDAFLHNGAWSTFHPNGTSCYQPRTDYVLVHSSNNTAYGFNDKPFSGDKKILIRKCEVELAIKLLLENGYYLYRSFQYGEWISYDISRNPRLTDCGVRVNEIRESDWSGYFQ